MPMNNWSFRRNGKHPTDANFKSPSSLTLDGELLKLKCSKGKKCSNGLDCSRVSPAPASPILGSRLPEVPPKTPGDPLVFSAVVRENGRQQPITLPRELTESPRLSRVPSGVVMVADIVLTPETPTPSSATTSIHSGLNIQPSVLMLTPLDDAPVPAHRNEAKPVLSDSVLVPPTVRIPVPSTTPKGSIQDEVVSSSTGSLNGSPVMVRANTVPHLDGISAIPVETVRPKTTPLPAPPKTAPRPPPASQQPTLSIALDSKASPTSDSPAVSLTAVMDISNNFFAPNNDNPQSVQQQQPPQQQRHRSQHQQQIYQQQGDESSQPSRHEPRASLSPSSPQPPPPPVPATSLHMCVPVKKNVQKPPVSFVIDAASLLRRLFNNPLYSDMDLSVDDTTFHVHRGVLAEHCRYFRELFTNARAQEPTTEIRHLDCSYTPIWFERGRPFSIVQFDSEDDSILPTTAWSMARLHARGDRPVQDPEGGGRDVLGSEDDEDGLYFANVEDSSSTGRGQGPTSPARATSQPNNQKPTDPSCLRTDPGSSGSNLDPKVKSTSSSAPAIHIDDEPISSFSAAFIAADQRSVGYTSHHFACFLQILYGLLHPFHLHEEDLLTVFRIAHIYGVPGLVNLLGDRIWDTLDLTTETWPCLVRFSERFCLEDIRRRALKHASETRELWTVAVETLGLDDFKEFLRGIDNPDGGQASAGCQRQGSDLRGLKDELLMMFLLVHYQESSGSNDSDPSLHRDNDSNSHTGASLTRGPPRCYQRDSARVKIRQQLQQRPSTGLSLPNLPTRVASKAKNNNSAGNKTITGSSEQASDANNSLALGHVLLSSSPPSSLRRMPAQAQTTKVDKAKMWMTRFKHECGWSGQVSLLD